MRAKIRADDPDKHKVVITKTYGPGKFPQVEGKGEVSGIYKWKASGEDPWQVVRFEATDPCGATDRAYLYVQILQPRVAFESIRVYSEPAVIEGCITPPFALPDLRVSRDPWTIYNPVGLTYWDIREVG